MSEHPYYYSMVVDSRPLHSYEADNLLFTLEKYGEVPRERIVVQCTERVSEQVRNEFAKNGYTVALISPYLDEKYCNKIAQLDYFVNSGPADACGFFRLDLDLVILSSIDVTERDHVWGKIVDGPTRGTTRSTVARTKMSSTAAPTTTGSTAARATTRSKAVRETTGSKAVWSGTPCPIALRTPRSPWTSAPARCPEDTPTATPSVASKISGAPSTTTSSRVTAEATGSNCPPSRQAPSSDAPPRHCARSARLPALPPRLRMRSKCPLRRVARCDAAQGWRVQR